MKYTKLFLYTDGGSRQNPGQAAIGAVLTDGKVVIETLKKRIGIATNNEAEYTAFIEGLKMAQKYSPDELVCFMDSELVRKQLLGLYRVKEPRMQVLCSHAQAIRKTFKKIEIEHVPREKNKEADKLVNEALDTL